MKKFNVCWFLDGGFMNVISSHDTREAAVRQAKIERQHRCHNHNITYRVVTAGTLKNAFGLEVR